MATCPDCGEPFSSARRKSRERCNRCYDRRYRKQNLERVKGYHHKSYLKHREKRRADARERAAQNRSDPAYRRRKAEEARRRRLANPDHDRLIQRRNRIKRAYGLTLEEYDAILARGCAICGSQKGRVVGKRGEAPAPEPQLCLDHDHTNGKVRDALCHSCNTGLGSFADDPTRLRAAADYLESHQ